ncbi:MAG: hypothetical protein PVI67_11200, partial [Anaerolineae bacterium]
SSVATNATPGDCSWIRSRPSVQNPVALHEAIDLLAGAPRLTMTPTLHHVSRAFTVWYSIQPVWEIGATLPHRAWCARRVAFPGHSGSAARTVGPAWHPGGRATDNSWRRMRSAVV